MKLSLKNTNDLITNMFSKCQKSTNNNMIALKVIIQGKKENFGKELEIMRNKSRNQDMKSQNHEQQMCPT